MLKAEKLLARVVIISASYLRSPEFKPGQQIMCGEKCLLFAWLLVRCGINTIN
jgi:hypothetical protein